MPSVHQGFQETNQTAAESLFRFLDLADSMAFAQECKRRMLEVGPVHLSSSVLDVGCGVGHEVQRLAHRIGPSGRAVGIDKSEPMIAEARRRAAGLSLPIAYHRMDAHQLEFPDHVFDLCRAERVLRFADDPQRVLNEMVRVVRPGGQIVVFDFDSDVTVVDAPDRTLACRISDILDNAVPQGWMGRQLFRFFRTSGLADITVAPHVALIPFAMYQRVVSGTLERAAEAGALSATDLATWWHALEHAEQEGIFFAANLGFIVSGWKSL